MQIPGFTGRALTRDDAQFETARRVWNGAIDRIPKIIALCSSADDVVAALRHARENDLLVSVRAGGHGVAGHAVNDGGIVIDLGPLKGVRVDARQCRAYVEGGALWGDVDAASQAFGLATTGGIVSHTGVAGLTLGGGIGWLMRKHGTTADNLARAELVTAEGGKVFVSEREDPELLWGLRGGGGNFGIVTRFEFALHRAGPTVLAGPILWPMENAPEVMRFYTDFAREAPDELTTIVQYRTLPAFPTFPAELHGRKVLQIGAVWAGEIAKGERALAALRSCRAPLFDGVSPRPYVAHQCGNDKAVPHGWHYYWKSMDVANLDSEMVDVITEHSLAMRSPRSYTVIFQLGGAVARVAEDATAYSHRSAAFNININGVWLAEEPVADQESRWVRNLFDALRPHEHGVYVNFLMDEGQQRVRDAFGPAKYARLAALKNRLDPQNVFRMNQNIAPSRD